MPDPFEFRQATSADAAVIAHHRASMFRDMGVLPPAQCEPLQAMAHEFLETAITCGDYVGWLATATGDPGTIIAGAGVQLRRIQPFPQRLGDGRVVTVAGRQALVVNVYTEPAFRRRGLARALMLRVLEWAQSEHVESLVLHAAPDARPLYESLGFVPTNEMRFEGDLAEWSRSR